MSTSENIRLIARTSLLFLNLVTYVTGCYRLTTRRIECKHLLFDASRIVFQDRTCLQNLLPWGGESKPLSASGLPFSSLSGSKTAVL